MVHCNLIVGGISMTCPYGLVSQALFMVFQVCRKYFLLMWLSRGLGGGAPAERPGGGERPHRLDPPPPWGPVAGAGGARRGAWGGQIGVGTL